MVLSYSISDPIKNHVNGSRYFCFAIPLTMLFSYVLSFATGVGGYWYPISARSILMAVAFYQFSNNPPNYDSVADLIKLLIMLHSTRTGPFLGALILLVF